MKLTKLANGNTHTHSHTYAIIYYYVQILLHSLLTFIKSELYLAISLFLFFPLCQYVSITRADALLTAVSLEHNKHMLEVNRYVLMEHINGPMKIYICQVTAMRNWGFKAQKRWPKISV